MSSLSSRQARRAIALPLLLAAMSFLWVPFDAQAAEPVATQASSAMPTAAEIRANTVPLIRPRLRLPDSLHQFAVVTVQPTADDPERFLVEVSFKAKTPFGSITEHRAKFHMKRSASGKYWIVTTE